MQAGGLIEAIYYCPHNWDDGCECRKPRPGMLFQAQRDHHLDLSRVVFIGDNVRDAEAADSAGCPSVLLSERSLSTLPGDRRSWIRTVSRSRGTSKLS